MVTMFILPRKKVRRLDRKFVKLYALDTKRKSSNN